MINTQKTMNDMSKQSNRLYSKQAGVTLIEILVTVVIMAIGLLGLAAMQNTSMKLSYDSYLRTQASLLAYDLMDRVRANPSETYGLTADQKPSDPSCIGNTKNCTPRQILEADLSEWHANASEVFPDGEFVLIGNATGQYSITIDWQDRYDVDEKAGDGDASFIYHFDVR